MMGRIERATRERFGTEITDNESFTLPDHALWDISHYTDPQHSEQCSLIAASIFALFYISGVE